MFSFLSSFTSLFAGGKWHIPAFTQFLSSTVGFSLDAYHSTSPLRFTLACAPGCSRASPRVPQSAVCATVRARRRVPFSDLRRDPRHVPRGSTSIEARHRSVQGIPRCLRRRHRHVHQEPVRVERRVRVGECRFGKLEAADASPWVALSLHPPRRERAARNRSNPRDGMDSVGVDVGSSERLFVRLHTLLSAANSKGKAARFNPSPLEYM